jgi:hypothetical protein
MPITVPLETLSFPWIPMVSVVAIEEPPIVPVTVVEVEPPPPLEEPHAIKATREEAGNHHDEFIERLLFCHCVVG